MRVGWSRWASPQWCPLSSPSAQPRLPAALCQVLCPLRVAGCGQNLQRPTATKHGQTSLPQWSGEHPSNTTDTAGAWVPRDGTVGCEETEGIYRGGWAGFEAGQYSISKARTMWVFVSWLTCLWRYSLVFTKQLPKILPELPIYSNWWFW